MRIWKFYVYENCALYMGMTARSVRYCCWWDLVGIIIVSISPHDGEKVATMVTHCIFCIVKSSPKQWVSISELFCLQSQRASICNGEWLKFVPDIGFIFLMGPFNYQLRYGTFAIYKQLMFLDLFLSSCISCMYRVIS